MKPYRLRLTLLGPLGTGLSGDTLFGHLCWGMVYHEGAAALEAFLGEMRSSEPPLIVGDPLPAGMLPNPLIPPADAAEAQRMEHLAAAGSRPARQAHDLLKRARKRAFIPAAVLAECLDELTAEHLLARLLPTLEGDDDASPAMPLKPAMVAHNTIDRLSQHTTEETGLFFQVDLFPPGPVELDVYLLSTLPPGRILTLFRNGLAAGYGRDTSTGRGRLAVGELDDSPWPAAAEPNAALALGVFTPAENDPHAGWWKPLCRLGKVSGAWAHDEQGRHPPFKFPLTLLAAGSVLGPIGRRWLGRVVPGVHPSRRQVVTCAMAPVLPIRCPHLPPAHAEVA